MQSRNLGYNPLPLIDFWVFAIYMLQPPPPLYSLSESRGYRLQLGGAEIPGFSVSVPRPREKWILTFRGAEGAAVIFWDLGPGKVKISQIMTLDFFKMC